MNQKSLLRGSGVAVASFVTAYGAYAVLTWLRYGHYRSAKKEEADQLLDQHMPEYEVVERHHTFVHAPAELTLTAACDIDLEESRIVRTIFKGREFLLRGQHAKSDRPRGMLAKMKALGWGVLEEVPGREIVMGAVTQPWVSNVHFRTVAPGLFSSFADPLYVKIAWTLRADPVTPTTSIFRTETRVFACGPAARLKFRKYWALLSPGIILIRFALLDLLRRKAESRARFV